MESLETIERADEELGRWRMFRKEAGPALRPFASCIVGYDQDRPALSTHVTPANVLLPFVIGLGSPHQIVSPGSAPAPIGSFIAGIHDAAGEISAHHFSGVQVDLTPLGAYRLLGGTIADLTGTAVPLADAIGPDASALVEQVGNDSGWEERLERVERFLVAGIQSGRTPSPEVEAGWEMLVRSGGRLSVDEVAREVGWSSRHFGQRVVEQIGMPPKRLARIIRFHRATRLLETGRSSNLGRLAHDVGYSDQSHFNHEMKALSGRTPSDFLQARGISDSSKRSEN